MKAENFTKTKAPNRLAIVPTRESMGSIVHVRYSMFFGDRRNLSDIATVSP